MNLARTSGREVYDHLLRRMFDAGLVPGSALREALGRLAEYGVVETRPNHGAPPAPQVREALAGMACGRLIEADFARLDALAEASRDEHAPGYLQAFDEFDVGLHTLIAARSGNPVLAREIGKLLDMTMRIHDQLETVLIPSRRIDPGEPGELRRMCWHHHVEIIDALKSGRPDACRRAMVTHLRETIRYKAGLMPPSGAAGPDRDRAPAGVPRPGRRISPVVDPEPVPGPRGRPRRRPA